MPPTFLWVLKFDVKLGVGVKILKFTAGRWLFYFWFQKCHFFFLSIFSLDFQNLMSSWAGVKIFKFTAGRWLFYFRFQKCHFFQRILKRILNVKWGVGVKNFYFLLGAGGQILLFEDDVFSVMSPKPLSYPRINTV